MKGSDEKQLQTEVPSQDDPVGLNDPQLEWAETEEKAILRKIDLIVMPLLMAGFFTLQLDRSNIANALTDFFLKDVGIQQNEFNIGQQLFAAGVLVLQLPSNLILYRVGPAWWLSCQVIAWGLVATFQAFQHGLGAFLATRLILGITEAGFVPASLFTIGRWYKKDETTKRFAWFFIGSGIASGCSGLLAYGVLHMRDIAGLRGWQWLFILEGTLTVLVGIAFLFLFPKGTSNPVSILGIRFFNEREARILTERVLRDDPAKAQPRLYVSSAELKSALTNWRILPHMMLTILGLAPTTALGSYAPTLINLYGFDRLKSNLMVSVGSWLSLPFELAWGIFADWTGVRGPWVWLGTLIQFGLFLGNRLVIDSDSKELRFGILVVSMGFSNTFHVVNTSWVSLNSRSAGERTVQMALVIMSATSSGLIGKQLFRQEDAPRYQRGWSVIVGLTASAFVVASIALGQYVLLNKKGKRQYHL